MTPQQDAALDAETEDSGDDIHGLVLPAHCAAACKSQNTLKEIGEKLRKERKVRGRTVG